jgi:peptidoglycan/xylan/chitin deacetylase (PgdA/CDA1 family)
MLHKVPTCFLILATFLFQAQQKSPADIANRAFLARLNADSTYLNLKKKMMNEFTHATPGRWGEFVKGVYEDLSTKQKFIAFTFDACGGEKGTGIDKELTNFLKQEKVPATLFVTGRWIDAHFDDFMELGKDTLFEIENHGLNHRPLSIDGESQYGIHGTNNAGEAFDEIEANARKIEALTGRRPLFFRSATAYTDEACTRMAHQLGITIISFSVLSGDAIPGTPAQVIENNVLKNIRPGAIVIMHMNHPQWNTFEAMQKIVPELRKRGYRFAHLKDFKLADKKGQEQNH